MTLSLSVSKFTRSDVVDWVVGSGSSSLKVGTHKATSPWLESLEKVLWMDWLQGKVPASVSTRGLISQEKSKN